MVQTNGTSVQIMKLIKVYVVPPNWWCLFSWYQKIHICTITKPKFQPCFGIKAKQNIG